VELPWDSLFRGFPVGSFLLVPCRQERSTARFVHEQGIRGRVPGFHLLDGQQRCNAIALGFLDVWRQGVGATAALWIDLDPAGTGDERAFVARVVTRSHPWGYQRRDPAKTLEQRQRRVAFRVFREVARRAEVMDESGNPLW